MKTVVIGAILNVLLDPLFIFVLGLGVRGAAVATVLSQAVSAAWVLKFLTGKSTVLRLRRTTLRIDRRLLTPALALGASPVRHDVHGKPADRRIQCFAPEIRR